MTQNDYEMGLKSDKPHEDVVACLSEAEKRLVKKLNRIEIRGKYNRKVPILLTESMRNKLKKIMDMRSELQIDSNVFARRHSEKLYRGCDVIRSMAEAAGVKDLHLFTWTHLRKHVATLSQAMEISENDQDMLAVFLGHSIRVHVNITDFRRIYFRKQKSPRFCFKSIQVICHLMRDSMSVQKNLSLMMKTQNARSLMWKYLRIKMWKYLRIKMWKYLRTKMWRVETINVPQDQERQQR